jgi:hypothetical protein
MPRIARFSIIISYLLKKKTDPNTPATSANVEEPPTLRTILIEMRCSQNRKSSSFVRENT